MLAPFPLNPILPAKDGARAEAFYRDVLGLGQLSAPGMDPMAFGAGNNFGPVKSTWLRDSEDNILALNELTTNSAP